VDWKGWDDEWIKKGVEGWYDNGLRIWKGRMSGLRRVWKGGMISGLRRKLEAGLVPVMYCPGSNLKNDENLIYCKKSAIGNLILRRSDTHVSC
jgi:hypothetical protein